MSFNQIFSFQGKTNFLNTNSKPETNDKTQLPKSLSEQICLTPSMIVLGSGNEEETNDFHHVSQL